MRKAIAAKSTENTKGNIQAALEVALRRFSMETTMAWNDATIKKTAIEILSPEMLSLQARLLRKKTLIPTNPISRENRRLPSEKTSHPVRTVNKWFSGRITHCSAGSEEERDPGGMTNGSRPIKSKNLKPTESSAGYAGGWSKSGWPPMRGFSPGVCWPTFHIVTGRTHFVANPPFREIFRPSWA